MKHYLQSFNLLTEAEIHAFQKMTTPKKLKKGDFFIKEGRVCREIAFVCSGLLRSFYYSSNSEEVTYCLTFENAFIAAYSSFITQEKRLMRNP